MSFRLREMEGRFFWILAAAGVLIAVALILGANIQRTSAQQAPAPYRTAQVVRADIEDLVKAPGDVTVKSAGLPMPLSGVVSDVLVKPGSVVQAGQPLLKLDTREAEANLQANIAAQKSAQARLETLQNGPARELATAQQNLKIAQARVENLKLPDAKPDDLAAAQAGVDTAVYRYNALVSRPNPQDVAAAEAGLRAAKARLEKVNADSTAAAAALREAEARLAAAKQKFEREKITRDAAVRQAELNLEKANNTLKTAQETYDSLTKINPPTQAPTPTPRPTNTPTLAPGRTPTATSTNRTPTPTATPRPPTPTPGPNPEQVRQARLTLDQAKLNVTATLKTLETSKAERDTAVKEAEEQMNEAVAALEKVQAGAPQQAILNAQAEVDKAQAEYTRAAAGPLQDEVNAAQSEINRARAYLDALNKGASDKDIQLAQAEVNKFQEQVEALSKGPAGSALVELQGELERTIAQVKQAQLRIEQASLLAPYNSIVESVNVAPGQTVAPGPAVVTLVDLSALNVEARVNESNIQRIKVGQASRVYFENISGVREEPFSGKVTYISLRGARNSDPQPASSLTPATNPPNNIGYPVTILLDRDRQTQALKPGMTGRVRFVLERRPNALLVPKIAVRNIEAGTVIDVLLGNGQIVATPVTLGLSNDDYVEVVEDGLLREGDNILVHGQGQFAALPTPGPLPSETPATPIGSVTPGVNITPGPNTIITPTPNPSETASTTPGEVTPTLTPTPEVSPTIAPNPTTPEVSPTTSTSGQLASRGRAVRSSGIEQESARATVTTGITPTVSSGGRR